ncbi:hypothetical protein DEO72_LG3g1311 [Vigna unguiculata]|uniref:Uncharacterized protein n=1 Tax=Vigna unguiculata TaxID=3917 RepID=A0A4D6LEN1_VIGUN|nr:hypothetical protein DEO72_LG3g1311 [Vigna unguiculata]
MHIVENLSCSTYALIQRDPDLLKHMENIIKANTSYSIRRCNRPPNVESYMPNLDSVSHVGT